MELACPEVVETQTLSIDDIDADVLATMGSLQCFSDRSKLVAELVCEKQTTEKVIYFLLLDRKLRHPCSDDPDEVRRKTLHASM